MKLYAVKELNYGWTNHVISTKIVGKFATANQANKFANKYQRQLNFDKAHYEIIVEPVES